DGSGNLYVADTGNQVVKKVTSGGVVTVLAGSGSIGSNNATLLTSTFFGPTGVAVNSAGTFVYVTDANNQLIRKIDIVGNAVTTIGGTTGVVGANEGTPGTSQFSNPQAIAVDAGNANVYVADYGNNKIRKIVLSSSTSSTV